MTVLVLIMFTRTRVKTGKSPEDVGRRWRRVASKGVLLGGLLCARGRGGDRGGGRGGSRVVVLALTALPIRTRAVKRRAAWVPGM
jgi:hypothetical protein